MTRADKRSEFQIGRETAALTITGVDTETESDEDDEEAPPGLRPSGVGRPPARSTVGDVDGPPGLRPSG